MLCFHSMMLRQLKGLLLIAGLVLAFCVLCLYPHLRTFPDPLSLEHSGNHAAALALAAKLRGIPAYIVIPKNAPKCKVENVIRHGGQVIWSEPNVKCREDVAAKVLQDTGSVLIHPYNDGRIIRYFFLAVYYLPGLSFSIFLK